MPPPARRLRLALLFALLYGCALVPLFLCDPLPLNDYPNHMARMHLIAELDRAPELQRHYAIEWQLLPNLALDLVVPPLARLLGAERATWLFTALLLLLLATGAVAVHWVLFRQLTPYPFAAMLLLYNRELLWGFLNFCFGVGLGLWVLAGWLLLRERSTPARLPLLAAMAVLLYFAHIHAYGSTALLIGGYELAAAWPRLRSDTLRVLGTLATRALALAVPLPLFVLGARTAELAGDISYGAPLFKLSRLLSPFNNYSLPLDGATWLICAALLGYGLLRRRLRLHPQMRLPLLILLLAFVALPQQLFDAWSVDRRVVLVLAFVLLASTNTTTLLSRRQAVVAAAALGLLFVLRSGTVALNWQRADATYAGQLALLDRVERGSRLAIVVVGHDRPHLQNPPLWELGNMAVIRRHVHVNSMFAQRGHHILRVRFAPENFSRSPSQKFVIESSADPNRLLTDDIYRRLPLRDFDYLYLVNEQLVATPRPPWLRPIAAAAPGALYRIDR